MARPKRGRAYCQVNVNGQDVTSKFDPYLISIVVTDYEQQMDTCVIDLDDSHGVLEVPADNAPIEIRLGWQDERGMQLVFTGKVSDVSSTGQRRSGRLMRIEGNGADVYGDGKKPSSQEWGEGTPAKGEAKKISLQTVMDEAAKKAGYSFKGAADICKIEKDYWAMTNESFHSFGERLASEVGGVFKVSGNVATITSNINNVTAVGQKMADVECAWGKNLIAWNIHPKVGRPVFAETAANWFDDKKGVWETVKKAVGGGGGTGALSKALHFGVFPFATKEQATVAAQASANASLRARGYGWIVIDGEPGAATGATAKLSGARAGVDGDYRIIEAEHTYLRKGGYTTRLQINTPGAGTGAGFQGEFSRGTPKP